MTPTPKGLPGSARRKTIPPSSRSGGRGIFCVILAPVHPRRLSRKRTAWVFLCLLVDDPPPAQQHPHDLARVAWVLDARQATAARLDVEIGRQH